MCTTAIITGAVCFLVGFGLGCYLNWDNKKPEKKPTKEYLDYIVSIKYNG